MDHLDFTASTRQSKKPKNLEPKRNESPTKSGERSSSSGYGGSHGDSNHHQEALYSDLIKVRQQSCAILEQNPDYVKAIQVTAKCAKNGSSSGSTLTTIPEGKIDLAIPRPIWPYNKHHQHQEKRDNGYDSLVDDTLLLYTSFNFAPDSLDAAMGNERHQFSVKDVLVDLLQGINATIEGKTGLTAEEMLRCVNEKIALSIETLRTSTEEEMKNLCVNLSNCKKVNSVVRAFSNSSSGNSSQSSPESSRSRLSDVTSTDEVEIEIYHSPSGSSSSGFSDSVVKQYDGSGRLPVFVHEDLSSVPNGVRNAMIYGTLYNKNNLKSSGSGSDKLLVNKDERIGQEKSKRLLQASDSRPSVWEQYYGIKVVTEGEVTYAAKPTDVPLFVSIECNT